MPSYSSNVLRRALGAVVLATLFLVGCSEADVASNNTSQAADRFEVMRRVVFVNGITDKYLLSVEGYCSLGNSDKTGQLTVTCKTGEGQYKKHFLGLSDNVTYFVEQLQPASVSGYHYKVTFRPEVLVPGVDIK